MSYYASLPCYNEALHAEWDTEHWPRFIVRDCGKTWADGTVYLQFDRPNHCKAVKPNGTLSWEHSGPDFDFDRANKYNWHRSHVSPLYALSLAMYLNGVTNA